MHVKACFSKTDSLDMIHTGTIDIDRISKCCSYFAKYGTFFL